MEWLAQAMELVRSWFTDCGPRWVGVATGTYLALALAMRQLRRQRKISLEDKVIFITGCDSGFGSVYDLI